MEYVFRFDTKILSTLLIASFFTVGCTTTQQSVQNVSSPNPEIEKPDTASLHYKPKRPVPNPIDFEIPDAYKRTINEKTRSSNGAPGSEYWQQRVDYDMDVELLPEEKRISAKSTIVYHNNSPDTLWSLVLELAQNLHAEGAPRKESTEITGGIDLKHVAVEGQKLEQLSPGKRSGYVVDGTRLILRPSASILPGTNIEIETEWSFEIPGAGASGRMGHSKDNLFFIAYWYPQVMVYDDVFGWFTDAFRGNAEFYHEFGEYTVDITAPEQWIVRATGKLQNADEVLSDPVLERYKKAFESDTVVRIAGEEDFGKITHSGTNGTLTWSYSAENVRDFAFSLTKESIWEGARAPVGDADGDGDKDYTLVDVLFRSNARSWTKAVDYAQHSITFLSEFMNIPYPWPHMTSVEGAGIIGGGMEFPMMTIIGPYYNASTALYYVIAHEFAHMWVPMIVSTNERRFSWMDEGTTTFNENQARKDFFDTGENNNPDINDFVSYLNFAGTFLEGPIIRWSDYHYPGPGFGIASYSKPASGLVVLRTLLGEETFMKAFQTFLDRWKYKHPYPWDMFNTFEEVSGRDLDWFWRSFYYETWILDQAVSKVESTKTGTRIVIEDRGQIPLPAIVEISFKDGTKITRTIAVDTWLKGATYAVITVDNPGKVVKVQIDPGFTFPDADRSNNKWER